MQRIRNEVNLFFSGFFLQVVVFTEYLATLFVVLMMMTMQSV